MKMQGFLVQATNAVNGSIPILWVAKLATNGSESVWQLGLKSVAREKFQLFSKHSLIPFPKSFPNTYGVPGRKLALCQNCVPYL